MVLEILITRMSCRQCIKGRGWSRGGSGGSVKPHKFSLRTLEIMRGPNSRTLQKGENSSHPTWLNPGSAPEKVLKEFTHQSVKAVKRSSLDLNLHWFKWMILIIDTWRLFTSTVLEDPQRHTLLKTFCCRPRKIKQKVTTHRKRPNLYLI